jgi:Arc/MetJ-type ribon-helix-helix transcriptional regulator
MLDETRIPVNAKIPKILHDSLLAAVKKGVYKDKTACITEALEKLLDNTQEEPQANNEVLQNKENEILNYKKELQEKYAEIQRLQSVIQESPDPVELAEMRGQHTVIQRLLEEKDKRIEGLEREVNTLNGFAHFFKNVDIKQIEAPADEKKKPWYKIW